jgi:hypothetical protein
MGVDQHAGGTGFADANYRLLEQLVVPVIPSLKESLAFSGVEVGAEEDVVDAPGVDGTHAEGGGWLQGVVTAALNVDHQALDGGGDDADAGGLDRGEQFVGAVVDKGEVLALDLGIVDGESAALGEGNVA